MAKRKSPEEIALNKHKREACKILNQMYPGNAFSDRLNPYIDKINKAKNSISVDAIKRDAILKIDYVE